MPLFIPNVHHRPPLNRIRIVVAQAGHLHFSLHGTFSAWQVLSNVNLFIYILILIERPVYICQHVYWCVQSISQRQAANDFSGVVVESFSYVFQLVGGTKSITREGMRAFKKVWAEFANAETGYLEKADLVKFLGVSTEIMVVTVF